MLHMKKIALLGSTGSIGQNTLKVARHLSEQIQVKALAASENIDLLEKQILEFNPDIAAVYNPEKAKILQERLPRRKILSGAEGIEAVATYSDVDFVVSAISGTQGLRPTVAAIRAGKTIGLANKEVMVSGGEWVVSLVEKHKVKLIPIDSEHSAIFQCLNGENPKTIRRIILTASGGPMRLFSDEQLENITPEQALNHPNWKMGPKVTIDCSTLMNKGLEVIEAYWLFKIPLNQIEVVIHPQSIIHSMVEFKDLSILAQMGEPSMLTPIQYALTYPERAPGLLSPFNFHKNQTLQFFEPDLSRFRCLALAYEALKKGGSLPAYMNAANEVLVQKFLHQEISWQQISLQLEQLMDKHVPFQLNSLEAILYVDALAREEAANSALSFAK